MRILEFLNNLNIIQLDIQELVDRFQRAADLDVVFELDGDFVVDERFEEAREGAWLASLIIENDTSLIAGAIHVALVHCKACIHRAQNVGGCRRFAEIRT